MCVFYVTRVSSSRKTSARICSQSCNLLAQVLLLLKKKNMKAFGLILVVLLTTLKSICQASCLCHVVPNFQCPPPPLCCESGMYSYDECGCCLTCAKNELQPCGLVGGECAKGLSCLKLCSKYIKIQAFFLI